MRSEVSGAEVLIVGAGIAGAAAAYFIGTRARCVILERESHPGYHSTGRSSALFTETYGNETTRALTVASRSFLGAPPAGFAAHAPLTPRGVLLTGTAAQRAAIKARYEAYRRLVPSVRLLDTDEALALVPVVRREVAALAVLEPGAMDIDVHAVHQGYLRGAAAAGTRLVCDAEVLAIRRVTPGFCVETRAGAFEAPVLIDAAGAWVDALAALAAVPPIGIEPKRRTAITFEPPPGLDCARWPMVVDCDETLYYKPDAGRLLATPADETPSPPCDAQPEELDVATVIDRLERASTLPVRRLVAKWAGLRSFVADRTLVGGVDPLVPGFVWLAGQGGYGIQTSPAMGRIAAAAALGEPFPDEVARHGVTAAQVSPARLRRPA
jgi:D-arginine dehydrogenase